MKSNNNIQRKPTECIDRQTFIGYASGTLSATEMYRVERHTAECPMCADELEGIMLLDNPTSIVEIESELNSKIDKRVEKGRVVSFGYAFRVAASFLVLLSISFLTYNYFSSLNSNYTLAENLYRKESVWNGKLLVDEKPFNGNSISVSSSGNGNPKDYSKPLVPSRPLAQTAAESTALKEKSNPVSIEITSEEATLDEVVVIANNAKVSSPTEIVSTPVTVAAGQAAPSTSFAETSSSKRSKSIDAETKEKSSTLAKTEAAYKITDNTLDIAAEAVASEREEDNEIYLMVQEMPQFKVEGYVSFDDFVSKKLKYSKRKVKANEECVYVEFVVEADGKVSNAKVVRAVNSDFDAEALRVVLSSPKWQPGIQRGMPVRVALTFPVKFTKN